MTYVSPYAEGDRITIPPDEELGIPREDGIIEEVYTMAKPGGDETFVVVRVDVACRTSDQDDGLREISVETLKELNEREAQK